MKKTLLSLALAAFATASFASATLYSAESSVGNTSVSVSGSQAFNYSNSFAKTNSAAVKSKNEYKLSADSKTVKFDLPTKFGLNVSFEDANKLAYSFDTEVKHNYKFSQDFDKKVENGSAKGSYKAGDITRTRSGFDFDTTTLAVSYPTFGTLTLGYNADTAASSNFGGNSDTDNFLSAYSTGDQDYSVNYQVAEDLVNGLNLAVSYATQDSSARSHVLGLNSSFEVLSNTIALDYALTVGPNVKYGTDNKKSARSVSNSLDLSYANTMVDGLEGDVDVALNYTSNKAADNSFSYSAGLELNYTEFSYFKPYAGVSYLGESTKSNDEDKATSKTNTLGTYLGAKSSYTYEAVTASVYGEVGYQTVLSASKKVKDVTSYEDKTSTLAYRLGVKFAF